MKHNYTPELLIKYMYRETDIADRLELEHALDHNSDLRIQYLDLLNSYRNLPKVTFSPEKSTIDNILAYSQATSMQAGC